MPIEIVLRNNQDNELRMHHEAATNDWIFMAKVRVPEVETVLEIETSWRLTPEQVARFKAML